MLYYINIHNHKPYRTYKYAKSQRMAMELTLVSIIKTRPLSGDRVWANSSIRYYHKGAVQCLAAGLWLSEIGDRRATVPLCCALFGIDFSIFLLCQVKKAGEIHIRLVYLFEKITANLKINLILAPVGLKLSYI